MAHRLFRDSHGIEWNVWDVHPTRAERRLTPPVSAPYVGPDRRASEDQALRVRLNEDFSHGWLAFESAWDKRRLAPIPSDWTHADDGRLQSLLDAAVVVGASRRLLG